MIAATIANVHRDARRRRTPFEARDFVLDFGPRESAGHDVLLEKTERIMRALGAG